MGGTTSFKCVSGVYGPYSVSAWHFNRKVGQFYSNSFEEGVGNNVGLEDSK